VAVLGLIDPLALRCGLTRLAAKRLPTVTLTRAIIPSLEQNALWEWQHFRLEGDLMAAAMPPVLRVPMLDPCCVQRN